jgi:hypothetical protein
MSKRGTIYSRAPVDLPTIRQEILEYFSKPVGRSRRAQQSVYGVRGPKSQGYDGPAEEIDEFSQRQDYLFVEKFLSTQVFVAFLN